MTHFLLVRSFVTMGFTWCWGSCSSCCGFRLDGSCSGGSSCTCSRSRCNCICRRSCYSLIAVANEKLQRKNYPDFKKYLPFTVYRFGGTGTGIYMNIWHWTVAIALRLCFDENLSYQRARISHCTCQTMWLLIEINSSFSFFVAIYALTLKI